MQWIENNMGKIVIFFLILFAIEFGVGIWRLPKEFRSSILPRLEEQIRNYNQLTAQCEHLINDNIKRINLLSEVEERRIIYP